MSSTVQVDRPVPEGAETRGGTSLSLLNAFELRCDGEVVGLPISAQRLLAFLALHERPLLRPYVAGTLWLEANDERAGASLRSFRALPIFGAIFRSPFSTAKKISSPVRETVGQTMPATNSAAS